MLATGEPVLDAVLLAFLVDAQRASPRLPVRRSSALIAFSSRWLAYASRGTNPRSRSRRATISAGIRTGDWFGDGGHASHARTSLTGQLPVCRRTPQSATKASPRRGPASDKPPGFPSRCPERRPNGALATSPAVIALPPASASSTAVLVAPGAVRTGTAVALALWRVRAGLRVAERETEAERARPPASSGAAGVAAPSREPVPQQRWSVGRLGSRPGRSGSCRAPAAAVLHRRWLPA